MNLELTIKIQRSGYRFVVAAMLHKVAEMDTAVPPVLCM